MKLQICSDLHLEFAVNKHWLKNNPLIPKAKTLIIAGDAYYLNRTYRKMDFIKRVADDFEQVYIIPGNHEYYEGYDAATAIEQTNEALLPNVSMVNNYTVVQDDIRLIFSTMWSKIKKNEAAITQGLTDFHRIQFSGDKFRTSHFNYIHSKCFEFIEQEVSKPGKKIVVTHHLPSKHCNPEKYQDSTLNEAFMIDKTDFIKKSDIDYWIYGHNHWNMEEINLDGTKLVTNQLGYVSHNEHFTFQRNKVIEVK